MSFHLGRQATFFVTYFTIFSFLLTACGKDNNSGRTDGSNANGSAVTDYSGGTGSDSDMASIKDAMGAIPSMSDSELKEGVEDLLGADGLKFLSNLEAFDQLLNNPNTDPNQLAQKFTAIMAALAMLAAKSDSETADKLIKVFEMIGKLIAKMKKAGKKGAKRIMKFLHGCAKGIAKMAIKGAKDKHSKVSASLKIAQTKM